MNTPIEEILSNLVTKVAEHFKLDLQDALEAVAMSPIANDLSRNGNWHNLNMDQICNEAYREIATGK